MSESLDGDPKGTSKSKISNFQDASSVNKKILGFEVSVDDPARMAIIDSVDKLEEEELNFM